MHLDRHPSNKLRKRFGIADNIFCMVRQIKFRQFSRVLRKNDGCGKGCMAYEVEVVKPRGRRNKT